MPGLKQLQQFNTDILSVGNETTLRASRGEKALKVPIPKDIKDFDDSDDFVLGLPEIDESRIQSVQTKPEVDDFSDIMGNSSSENTKSENKPVVPDFSSILNTEFSNSDSGDEAPDLSMFMEPVQTEVEEEVEEPKEVPISDLSLEDLLGGEGFDGSVGDDAQNNDDIENLAEVNEDYVPLNESENTEEPEPQSNEHLINQILNPQTEHKTEEIQNEIQNTSENIEEPVNSDSDFSLNDAELSKNKNDFNLADDFSVPDNAENLTSDTEFPTIDDLGDDFSLPDENSFKNDSVDSEINSVLENSESYTSEKPFNSNEEKTDNIVENAEIPNSDSAEKSDNEFNIPSDLTENLDFDIDNIPEYNPEEVSDEEKVENQDNSENVDLENFDFDLNDSENADFDKKDSENKSSENFDFDINSETEKNNSEIPEEFSKDLEPTDISSGTDFTDSVGDFNSQIKFDENDIPDFENVNFADSFGEDKKSEENENSYSVKEDSFSDDNLENLEVVDEKPEVFDISDMDGANFDFPETDSQIASTSDDFDLGDSSDFKSDNGDFEIPGFSDVDSVQENKNGKIKRQTAQSQPENVDKKKSLTDEEYKRFLKNLSNYPLNVRIAFEELLVNDDFTDEVEFELIQKVLKKVSARQLAQELEKMLDVSLPVPRDFERRSADEYEIYKSSFQYQLKNKIIPYSLVGVAAAGILYILGVFAIYCVYKPLKASSLYAEGYKYLENQEYIQSEQKFFTAREYDMQKKWYYKYSQGFRDQKQYLRAEKWYKMTLMDFDFDKKAGIDYAEMTLYDQENYTKAEEIVKRLVLDNHINDDDATLLLGDIYLEWATEKDPSKFDEAASKYDELIQRNGQNDLYLSRKMRYYVRTDNLEEVLKLKPYFFAREKSLNSADWTELSGYCLDKLYGPLHPQKEYLRSKIEDVKSMLVRAVDSDPQNPTAYYNISRYYIQVNNNEAAKSSLNNAIEAYKTKKIRKRKDIYNEIDSYRLLGERYSADKSFLEAEEKYTEGLKIFNEEKANSGLEANKKIGQLYADSGDIDYFVKGNMNFALQNYKDSIESGNDTPHIRYKIGYIQYGKENFSEALGSFLKSSELYPEDENLLFSMGNTLSQRRDYYAANGYFGDLIEKLDDEKLSKGILFPQSKASDSDFVDLYMKASNNYGVSLYNLSKRTGNSKLNGKAVEQFQNSLRAWDALSRNQDTMVRLPGGNLAEQNVKYSIHPVPDFEPALYSEIPKTLSDEKGLLE